MCHCAKSWLCRDCAEERRIEVVDAFHQLPEAARIRTPPPPPPAPPLLHSPDFGQLPD